MKRVLYIVIGAVVAATLWACNDKDIYSPVEFDVKLDAMNTYRVGDTVNFNISGNANLVTFWSGETSHEYRHRNRKRVAPEDIEKLTLVLKAAGQYGLGGGLKFFISKDFAGLNGSDAEVDRATLVTLEESGFAGWEGVPFADDKSIAAPYLAATVDITAYAANFVMMMWCKPIPATNGTQRTYYIDPVILAKFKGLPEQTVKLTDLNLKNFAPSAERQGDPYAAKPTKTDGYVAYVAPQIIVGGRGAIPQLENWICSTPTALNLIMPDKGVHIKGYPDGLVEYGHVFTEPGIYTVSFVARAVNYLGESSTVKEFTVNIVEPVVP